MKRALSLILGLLLLLTAFSNSVSASDFCITPDDSKWEVTVNDPTNANVTIQNGSIEIHTVDYAGYAELRYSAEEIRAIEFDITVTGGGDVLVFAGFEESDGDKFGVRIWQSSTPKIDILASYSLYQSPEYSVSGGFTTTRHIKVEMGDSNNILVYVGDTLAINQTEPFDFSAVDKVLITVPTWSLDLTSTDWQGDVKIENFKVYTNSYNVQFSLKDALTGQSLSDVTVKDANGNVLGVIDDGGVIQLAKENYTLTFEKTGYWSVTKTINVQSDMSVTVEMYPSSTAFQFLNFPSSIDVYENSIYELTFTISPIDTSATYNTYLSISGLSNVLEVKKAGQVVSPESGKYYLGDISSDTQVSIKFKAGSIGTHSFTITLTSNDAIMSSTYTTSKQVAYNVIPLPFSVQMPSEWQVGANELRVSEASGQSILITAILKDSNGTEVWSDSASLDPYAAHTFNVNVPSEGTYTLELQFNGQAASWDITVNPAITLLTETVTASEGDIATIQVKINNPSSNTKYYTIVLEGPIIEGNVSKSVSVAPLSEKTVDVSFQVPNELEYDAYDLNIKVYEGDALQYSDIVHLIIDNSGFSLPFFGGGSSSNIDSTWLWLGAGVLALFVFIMALRRR